VERLGHWSVAGLEKAPLPGEGAPGGRQEMLEEARQAYALGEGAARVRVRMCM
jgi:hypothetical protein